MKKLLTLLLVCAAAACTHEPPENAVPSSVELNEGGHFFMQMLHKRPDWQKEWSAMQEHGTPLPNEVIVMSGIGSGRSFAFIPVVDGKDVVRLVVCPIDAPMRDSTRTRGANAEVAMGTPRIFDKKTIDENSVSRSFIGLDVGKPWREKGYIFDVEITPPTRQVQTRSSMVEVRFEVYWLAYPDAGKEYRNLLSQDDRENVEKFKPHSLLVGFTLPRWHFGYFTTTMTGAVICDPYDHSQSTFEREFISQLGAYLNGESWHGDYYSMPIEVTYDYFWIFGGPWDDYDGGEDTTGDGGGGGSGGSDDGDGSGGEGEISFSELEPAPGDLPRKKPLYPEQDCMGISKHKNETAAKSQELFNLKRDTVDLGVQARIGVSFEDFEAKMNGNGAIEHSMSVDLLDDLYIADKNGIIAGTASEVVVHTNNYTVFDVHNHPNNTPPSALDVWGAMWASDVSSRYQGRYIYNADGTAYCIMVTDPAKARAFVINHAKKDVVGEDNMFNAGSYINKEYETAINKFSKLGTNGAWCHALSYVAEKHDMGVVILKKDSPVSGWSTKHVTKNFEGHYVPAECK